MPHELREVVMAAMALPTIDDIVRREAARAAQDVERLIEETLISGAFMRDLTLVHVLQRPNRFDPHHPGHRATTTIAPLFRTELR